MASLYHIPLFPFQMPHAYLIPCVCHVPTHDDHFRIAAAEYQFFKTSSYQKLFLIIIIHSLCLK